MSRSLQVLRRMAGAWNSAGDDGFDSGADDFDSGFDDGVMAACDAAGLDSGAVMDKLRGVRANSLARRAGRVAGRGAPMVSAKAAAVQDVALDATARKQLNKDKYRLYRVIALLAPQTIAAAGTATISVTPTSKGFAEYIVAMGLYRLDTLTIMGQTLLPNGAVSTSPFQGTNNGLLPVNLYLDTVPITGGVTNNSAASVYAGLDMMVWMEASADSERY